MVKPEPVNLKEIQYLLLLHKLEALAAPRRRSVKQGEVDVYLDCLDDELALASAIDLYASLKDSDQSAGARDPPSLRPLKGAFIGPDSSTPRSS